MGFWTFRLSDGKVVGPSIIFRLLDIQTIFFGFGLQTHNNYFEIAIPDNNVKSFRIDEPSFTINSLWDEVMAIFHSLCSLVHGYTFGQMYSYAQGQRDFKKIIKTLSFYLFVILSCLTRHIGCNELTHMQTCCHWSLSTTVSTWNVAHLS